ncbi:MAG: AAA family ATPase [Candidatus Rokubacteria bacterium]|nr:AAA family ATPase [Candidatus Rokubacteria bacterium]
MLIGPNKSGKSSFLDALQFICHAITLGDIAKPLDDRGGFASVFWRGKQFTKLRESDFIEFEMSGEVEREGSSPFGFAYGLSFSGDLSGRVFIKQEVLSATVDDTRRELIRIENGAGVARRLDGTQLFANPGSRTKPALSYDIPGWEAGIVKQFVVGWHFFNFIPQLAKTMSNTSAAVGSLDIHGSNLSSWLHTLQSNFPDEFQRIAKVAADAFPEIESLGTLVTQAGTTFLTLREKDLQSAVPIFQASDGELKFLMLVSLLYSPFGVGFICIEEPENHLHPRLLSMLVELANQRRQELQGRASQVIVATHSPYLVDLLDPEDIVLVYKQGGETVCGRPSSADELRKLLRETETTLGRLWFSGSLGQV